MSTSNQSIQFLKFAPESFAGINSENAKDLVIFFEDQNKRIVQFEGDQGQCKTSMLEFVKTTLGCDLPPNAINSLDKDMRGTAEFMVGDEKYTVRITKSSFIIKTEGPGKKGTINGPKGHLQSLIGNIGISPMSLKEMKGKDQIEWMRKMFRPTSEQMELEQRITSGHQKAYDERTDVNREINRLTKELNDCGYFTWIDDAQSFESNEKYFQDYNAVNAPNAINDEAINQEYQDAQKKVNVYAASKNKMETLRMALPPQEERVEELKKMLEEAEAKVAETKQIIEAGEKWMQENKDPKEELETIIEKMRNSSALKMAAKAIADADRKLSEFNAQIDHRMKLEAALEEYKSLHKQFVQDITPDIEGLELILGNWHPEKAEGIYYLNHSMFELSESQLWQLYFNLCKALGIKVVMLENISSIGTDGVNAIQQFADAGGYVFCTKMDRKNKGITISFHDKYPLTA